MICSGIIGAGRGLKKYSTLAEKIFVFFPILTLRLGLHPLYSL